MLKRKIKVGVVAFGMSARVIHCPLIASNNNYELVAVVERHAEKSKAAYPQVQVVRDLDTLLAIDAIDLVVITTPNDTHVSYAQKVLTSGKHCIVEKPFTVTEQEARSLALLASETGKVLSVFQNRRWDGDFLTVKKILAEDILGHVVEIESRYERFRSSKKDNAWREQEEFPGSGILYDLGSHLFDQIVDLYGTPDYVTATVRNERQLKSNSDDSFLVVLDYPSKNFKAICRAGMLVRDPPPRFTVLGTCGSFKKYGLDIQEEQLKQELTPLDPAYGKDNSARFGTLDAEIRPGLHVRGAVTTVDGTYQAYYDNVAAAIYGEASLIVTADQAADVIRIIELAKQSSNERRSLPF
ncbi:hypothetical protein GGI25_003672 [Coemansia spiralis]|uniref:Oxidoreductase n=2 Tax=Coemansia TaxID=4863 RepID=A0A9W8G1K7_9FUNG|nr:hypothetical protein BX070DRAFT_190891 [Coemansia spiralis]KAJ1991996.1 hypothetical protein EDC05_003151 [Coemansia umbellata]KAJ2625365.1 hypothetical protein GGI26_000836 [Coemansia sp. RSA 1358]KAJ2676166.1 hypothetical protein GGI25_003672 [Coemansia spiralis]